MIESTNKSKNFHLEQLQMKSITHQIVNLKPREKNIELRAIVLELLDTYETKIKERLVQYLISDGSASIVANFFGETGPQIKEGDILYISGAYTTLYNKKMILYQGKQNVTLKIGEYFMIWREEPNVSYVDWSNYEEMKDNKKI